MSFVALALSIAVQPAVIVPGESFGTVKLGMTEAHLNAHFPVKPGAIESWRRIGSLEVQLTDGRVVAIARELGHNGKAVKVKGKPQIRPRSPQQLARMFTGCGPLQRRIGGNIIECSSGVLIAQSRAGLSVRVVPPSTATTGPVCADYLEPGKSQSAIEIQPGKTYCLPSRTVTTQTRPDDVLGALKYNTCKTQVNIGATVVSCPFQGTRFVFAGPGAALHRVEGVPFQK